MCSLMCLVNMSLRANVLLHTSHKYALLVDSVDLDLCLEAMCLASRSWTENIWWQIGQR